MVFERLDEKYVDQALVLALAEYRTEYNKIKDMPNIDFKDEIGDLLTDLFQKKYGVVAKEGEKIIGYMAFNSPVDGFFGNCKGVFSPLGGSAFPYTKRQIIASKLLSAATEILVKEEGVTSFAISQYANDAEVQKSFVLNGFGIRCSDAIMKLQESKPRKKLNDNLRLKELRSDEKSLMFDLRKGLTMHMLKSPIYFPTHIGNYMDWFLKEEIRVFVACINNEIVGFMSFQDEAETFISQADGMVNICGAFVKDEFRGKNVATDLLHYVCNVYEKEGTEYLGVDCETLNPNALRFWGKHFKNYTYSYHRRIDERVIGYDLYLEKEWGVR